MSRKEKATGTAQASVDYQRLAEVFKAMGHPTRLGILHGALSGELCVSDLQQHLGRKQANISQHLAVLRDRGLVVPERRGANVCYHLTDQRIADIIELAGLVFGPPPVPAARSTVRQPDDDDE